MLDPTSIGYQKGQEQGMKKLLESAAQEALQESKELREAQGTKDSFLAPDPDLDEVLSRVNQFTSRSRQFSDRLRQAGQTKQ